ncbi:MAG: DNA-directed DNA polymerase II small subunit, partial [Methanoregulaceae archaeon]|nr:DNA-directed DNA polymerase II small subunit [Methanoregulaceae archaeon]
MLDTQTIVSRFLESKRQVHPDVVRYIHEQNDPALLDRILEGVPGDAVVVSVKHIPGVVQERDGARFAAERDVEVVMGARGSAGSIGGVGDYFHYFRDRYTRLGNILRTRVSPMPIEALTKSARYRQEACTVLGIVGDLRSTTNGHRIAEIEDPTGNVSVLFNKDRPGFSDAESLISDEVVGVRGTLSNDGRIFFADQLFRPDVPISHAPFLSPDPGKAIFISDIHVGSSTFLEDAWHRFAEWLEGSDASYLLVAGDLVDGIGIFPGQEQELTLPNIYAQYEKLGELISMVPRRIRIILAPGNHDVVRGAEPQPAIPEKFTEKFPDNCTFVENPAMVNLQGVHVLMYHGRSIDDMISQIPGATYEKPGPMMDAMLQRRHLAATYGRRTPIAADREDRLL